MKITLYAPCRCKCNAMMVEVKAALVQLGKDASIDAVSDPMELAAQGITMPPALAIDGEIVFHGRMPTRNELAKKLGEK